MNSNCKYVLFACVLVKLNMVWGDMDNIGFGYPESPDDDVSKQHVQVIPNGNRGVCVCVCEWKRPCARVILFIGFYCEFGI